MPGRNVLLIRLSAMGDIAMASPVIRVLKEAWPDCRLTWLVEDRFRDILAGHPRLDEVLCWPKGEWRRLAKEGRYGALAGRVRSFRSALRARRFDMALDMQGILKSAVWAWLSGAGERVGTGSKEGTSVLMTHVVPADRSDPRMGSEYRETMRSLGLDPGGFLMDLFVGDGEDRDAARLLAEHGVTNGYCVLCPFTTRPQKHWVEDRWKQVADEVRGKTGLAPVVLGGPGDTAASERIAAKSRIVNLAGKSTIRQAMAIVRKASLVLGVDTGLTHMGIGFGVPAVAIFGATRPYLETPNPRAVVLYKKEDCSPCRKQPTCNDEFPCMRAVSVPEVVEAAERALC